MLVRNNTKRDYVTVLIAAGLLLIVASGFAAGRLGAVETMVSEAERRTAAMDSQMTDSVVILDVCTDSYRDAEEDERLLQAVKSGRGRLASLRGNYENLIDTVEQIGVVERLLIYGNIKAAFDFLATETVTRQTQLDKAIETYADFSGSIPALRLSPGERQLADAK